jgi:glutathione S-transferase
MTQPIDAPFSDASIILYSARLSMFGAKVQIAALEKNIAFNLVMVPFTQAAGYSPKHPEVARINPKKQVPVLVHGSLEIFDSTQIFEYLEDLRPHPALWPADASERARARLLEHRSDEIYFPHIIRLMSLQNRMDDPLALSSVAAAHEFYETLEPLLANADYVAGNFSFADIALYMAMLFGARMGADLNHSTPRLLAWRDRMSARPAVLRVVQPMAEYLRADGRPLPQFLAAIANEPAA